MGKKKWTSEQEEYLSQLYFEGYELKDIQNKMSIKFNYDYSYDSIKSKIFNMGLSKIFIKKNNPNFSAIYQDYNWCYDNFVNKGLNHSEMAKIAGCSKRVIEKWCQEKHHIDTYVRMAEKTLNKQQCDLIIGSLLGDGHIDKREKYPLFIVSHAENQKDYLYYKYEIMKDLCEMNPKYYPESIKVIHGAECHCQPYYRFNTRTYNAFIPFREMSKINLLNQLNEYSFSIWMLDDGNCEEKGYWSLCAPLDTDEERAQMKQILKEKFNIEAIEQKNNRYFRFHTDDSWKITKMILNNIPNNLDIIQEKIFSKKKYQSLRGESE